MGIDQKQHIMQALKAADIQLTEAQNFIRAATPLAAELLVFKDLQKVKTKLEKIRIDIGMLQL